MNNEFTFKKYSPEYKEQVIELLGNLWDFNDDMKLKYFKWKYEDNPYTDGVEGYIALDGNKVIAYRGCMVEPIFINGSTHLVALMGDMVTHPNYRRMGLFQNTTKYCINELEKNPKFLFCISSSSGGPTSGGHLKLGGIPMSERKHLFRINLNGILAKICGKPKIFSKRIIEKNEIKIVITDEKDIEGMISIPYNSTKYSHIRNREFYNWRFGNPRANYVFAYLYKNNIMEAYIAFKDIGNARYDIIDFNQSINGGINELLNAFSKATHPTYISLWTVGKNNIIYNNYRKFGLVNLGCLYRFKRFQKPPFLIYKLKPNMSTHDMAANSWDLYKIISDEI